MRFFKIGTAVVGLSLLTFVGAAPTLAKQPIRSQAAKPVLIAQASNEVIIYSFPAEDITYSTNGTFNYKGRIFKGKDITIVDSSIGQQVSVKLSNGVDTITTFTLLLPNNPIQNGAKITAVGITDNFIAPRTNNDSYILLHGTVETVISDPPTN